MVNAPWCYLRIVLYMDSALPRWPAATNVVALCHTRTRGTQRMFPLNSSKKIGPAALQHFSIFFNGLNLNIEFVQNMSTN